MRGGAPHEDGWDVLVLGAGVAGLSCARQLAEAGLRVCVVEAREQVGGRVRTQRSGDAVLELGAEFVHGRPPELLALVAEAGLSVVERGGAQVQSEDGQITVVATSAEEERFAPLEELRGWGEAGGDDLGFRAWLDRSRWAGDEAVREGVLGYVEGFNAADADQISAKSLGLQQAAEDEINGERLGHVREGYDRVPAFLETRICAAGGEVRCGVAVTAVHWGVGRVAFETAAGELVARRAIITLPLGVLQAGAVRIVPEPVEVMAASRGMRMGQVCRFALLFGERFWAELPPQPAMQEMSFLFRGEELPSVWWTGFPEPAATLTGWVGGPSAEALLRRCDATALREFAIQQVGRVFHMPEPQVRGLVVDFGAHPWHTDPWSMGAYSYVGVGGVGCAERMTEPVERTLFFAGEHTDVTGHWGTVHGALRSGLRAATQVLAEH